MEIICLCVWEEISWIYSVAPQKSYSSIFGSPNPGCPRHFYIYSKFDNNLLLTIYCKFDEQLLVLWWWTQVSDTTHTCNLFLLRVLPPWNWYLLCWKSWDLFPVFDPRQSHVSVTLCHTLHPHGAALEGSSRLQTVTRFLKFHCFSKDNLSMELT